MTIDTGCSTSLVALHLACQSIRAGESDAAVVGGSTVLLNPDMFISMSSLG
jgi:acyl transferase domain-containing protein